MKIYAAFGLLLCVTALCMTACGGSDSTASAGSLGSASGGDPPTITKASLITKGDAICTETDSKQRKALKAYEKKNPEKFPSTAGIEHTLKVVALPPIATEIEELEVLGMPAGDRGKLKPIYAGFRAALKEAEAKPSVLLGSDEGPFEAPDKLAGAYGFKACAKAL
jgi:hypothetical protein